VFALACLAEIDFTVKVISDEPNGKYRFVIVIGIIIKTIFGIGTRSVSMSTSTIQTPV
jgi:hypothetical protein